MKIRMILILTLFAISITAEGFAKNIYVDNRISGNITNGTYSLASRNSNGSDGNAYTTIEAAVNAMAGGDDIYVRGGTYRVVNIPIPASKNGSSSNWSSIQSYQGEWAVIDGGNNSSNSVIIGSRNWDKNGNGDTAYWKFERLEIKGAGGGGEAAAFWINGGPFIIRFCYLHDNLATTYSNNPGAITSMVMHDSIIEYNYFKNNGSSGSQSHNCAHINIHSDYRESSSSVADINHAIRKNTVRYNLFDGSVVGFKHKNEQILGNRSGTDMRYKDYGDNIHHNLFVNCSKGIWVNQDFAQVHHNIIDHGDLIVHYSGGTRTPSILHTTVYNNTLINGRIINAGDANNGKHPYWHCYNNILDGGGSSYGNRFAPIAVYNELRSGGMVLTDNVIDRNYFYRTSGDPLLLGDRDQSGREGFLSVSQYNSNSSTRNYANTYNSGNILYLNTLGANKYKMNGSHVLQASITISNGGIGRPHPYLAGVTIPNYVGATDPKNNSWVDAVNGLSNISNLQTGNSDSDEGNDETPVEDGQPSTPENLRIVDN